ncbi:MAG TPA: type II toxin-antitoxin system RelE/ParE family toxin [Candidatus Binatia bacterium]|nr:type II toxin-antitoxin system RelE/ParE family toxin [Candidatus Binatia bacterium]
MAVKIVWTGSAWLDLENVADFIARDSPYYAAAVVRSVKEASRSLRRFAKRGRVVPEIDNPAIRELFVNNYRLIYRIEPQQIAILAFIYGSRDLKSLWDKRTS